jgi:hypothetical protein
MTWLHAAIGIVGARSGRYQPQLFGAETEISYDTDRRSAGFSSFFIFLGNG